jgi:hypothetical protein
MAKEQVNTEQLQNDLNLAKAQAAQLQTVAQEAVNRLIFIEDKLSPQLLRNPKWWNILFHWKEIMLLIEEIVRIIKEFKAALQKAKDDSNK